MPAVATSERRIVSKSRYGFGETLAAPSSASRKTLMFFGQLIAEARSTSKFLQIEKMYQELCSSIDTYTSLADNWDTYGAEKPSPHSIEATYRFLQKLFAELLVPNRVIPSAEGGMAVYFNSDNRTAYLEYRNSREVILAMFDDHSDPIIVELTENDADESRALSLIRSYITG